MLRAGFCSLVVFFSLALSAPAPATADSAPAPPTAIAKQHKESMAVLQASLRPKVRLAARVLLDRLAAPLPPKAKPRDVLATARLVVADQGYLALATRQPANIDTAVLLVLLDASQQNEQELARVRGERAAIAAIEGCKADAKCLAQLGPTAPMTAAEFETLKARLQASRDALTELSERDLLALQQLMDKKNQLETIISNVMKAGYEGGQAAIAALKAS